MNGLELTPPLEVLQKLEGVVCLIGTTRFKKSFERANGLLTKMGNVVLSVGFFKENYQEYEPITDEDVARFKRLHFQKIAMSDYVVVIEPDYIGDSTNAEIKWVAELELPMCGYTLERDSFEPLLGHNHNCEQINGLNDFCNSAVFKSFSEAVWLGY